MLLRDCTIEMCVHVLTGKLGEWTRSEVVPVVEFVTSFPSWTTAYLILDVLPVASKSTTIDDDHGCDGPSGRPMKSISRSCALPELAR